MSFPTVRLRRLRQSEPIRRLVRETSLNVNDLIQPFFVTAGKGVRRAIKTMPGIFQISIDELLKDAKKVNTLGVPALILFGLATRKDPIGSEAYDDNGVVQQAIRRLKDTLPDLIVISDLCFCEYTDHGHCGVLKNGKVDNDATLEVLQKAAVSQAKAGADIVAPSLMMDGMVKTIRQALDGNGYQDTMILSYAAKYASAFYGPFREAADSAPQYGDRKGYQMDPANALEAIREIKEDVAEGADIVMVKPALAYLDIIYRVKEKFDLPVCAYNVSGEYSLIKFGSKNKLIDEKSAILEVLTSIKRAGADMIITYHAKEVAEWMLSTS